MTHLAKSSNDPRFDLIVIGGGIGGACLMHEAVRCGLRVLLIERGDFGQATSGNSLRILHGGIRHLPGLRLGQCRRFAHAQRWFLRHFPRYVQRIPCIMPLMKSHERFTVASAICLQQWLTLGPRSSHHASISQGIHSRAQIARQLPSCDPAASRFAVWEEAIMLSPARLMIELLKQATRLNGVALNYTKVESILVCNGQVKGVETIDAETGAGRRFEAPLVANCAGPWIRSIDSQTRGELPVPGHFSLAVNLVLKQTPRSAAALLSRPQLQGDNSLLLVPRNDHLVAGTFHLPTDTTDAINPKLEHVDSCISQLNRQFPGLSLNRSSIVSMDVGRLPVSKSGERMPMSNDVVVDHRRYGGPQGLLTVCGVKYTTAPSLAQQVLKRFCPNSRRPRVKVVASAEENFDWMSYRPNRTIRDDRLKLYLRKVVEREAVRHLEDFVLRRSEWIYDMSFRDCDLNRLNEMLGLDPSEVRRFLEARQHQQSQLMNGSDEAKVLGRQVPSA